VFCFQMRQPALDHVFAEAFEVVDIKRLEVVFTEAALDIMGISTTR
jgi:hypothetical protein